MDEREYRQQLDYNDFWDAFIASQRPPAPGYGPRTAYGMEATTRQPAASHGGVARPELRLYEPRAPGATPAPAPVSYPPVTRESTTARANAGISAAAGLLDMINPISSVRDSMSASRRMFSPGLSPLERLAAGEDMVSGMAGAALDLVPGAYLARRGGGMAADLTEEMLRPLSRDIYRVGQDLMPPARYQAVGKPSTVTLPGGSPVEARPVGPIRDAAEGYMRERGLLDRAVGPQPFSEERARLIAAEFDAMQHAPQDPAVRRSYDAMISETLDQYSRLKDSGIDFKFLQPGMEDPYAASPSLGYRDMVENGRLWVFPTDFGFGSGADAGFNPAENPLLTRVGRIGDKPDAVANDAFRVVHDAFGHFGPGNPFFRHKGEERAWLEHSRMYSPEARGAMTSETRGQNSWLNSGPFMSGNRSALGADTVFADQKSGLMAPWTSDPMGMPDPEREAWLRKIMAGW